jgi:chromosome partitioning protein
MMMNVIAVVAQKGGTGKSLVSANMAVAAVREGRKTLVADGDPQGSMVDWSKTRLSPGPSVIAVKASALHPTRFAAENAGVDLLVIDTRSSALEDSIEAAKAAHLTLVVVRPTAVDLRAIAMTVKALKPLGLPAAFVLNQAPAQRVSQEPAIVNEAIELLLDYGLPIVPVGLRQRLIYQTSFARGLSAAEADPQSKAAEEMAELWAYVKSRLPAPAQAVHRPAPAPWFVRADQQPNMADARA